ncbi:MAG: ATP-binding cassette domain-containing protein [Candidatus Sumerlaeia bacterium]|nr:ATP-binding cassette domain-containing protein [Candidatus Sumerlaeia bacterium]
MKIYGNLRRALDGVHLELGEGVFGLLGPNGAGKTSLMEILSGGLGFEAGTIAFADGVDVARQPREWRRRLGYMPQAFDFLPHQTGVEVLEEACLLLGLSPRAMRPRIEALLERVNLVDAARRDAASYSRGMKQRLGVALALLHDPQLLLMDEPTAGLDPEERVFFRDLLAELAPGRVTILSTHIVGDVERTCARLGVIAKGRVLFTGTPAELTARVRGKVWALPVGREALAAWPGPGQLLGIEAAPGGAVARVLAASPPGASARPVEATLEDAYMGAIGEAGETWAEAAG